ncbi:sigma-70 family RNA polymerase sigma factor [Erysipelothrix inopinata]|uniref:Sigma-70 family RNA polymerase sigma factor n=2 Tax=Erysipelothrix inopinata TaxID=225084 RepID=A0A7G9S192_9FIRM|nr:sigma-70 family RNA polymerase sigma factor [Erysipelothrix inopinata]QNN61617.1 sigma-70 family RNA polymerase sigma factor [Erysipelothrix inopinata]
MEISDYKKAIRNDKHLVVVLQSFSVQMQKIAFSYYNNSDFADEVICSTIYKVYKNRKKVRKPEYFKTWVMRILINECKDELKRRNQFVELVNLNDLPVQSTEDYSYVKDYLNTLTTDEQEIIRLKVYSQFSFREVGEMLEIPESTIKSKYYSILKKLKIEMEDNYE